MSEIILPTLDRWHRVDNDGYMRLVHPLTNDYDTKRPPAYIQNDPRCAEGLNFLDDQAQQGRIIARVSLGPNCSYEDMGDLGWAERQIDETDAFGHDVEVYLSPENGYGYRVLDLAEKARQAFVCTPEAEHFATPAVQTLTTMQAYVENALAKIDEAATSPLPKMQEFAKELEGYTMIGTAVVLSDLSWYKASMVGLAAKEGLTSNPDKKTWSTFAVDTPDDDFAGALDLLGARVQEEPYRRQEEFWSLDDRDRFLAKIIRSGILQ